jgi:hypothetical protein
MPFTAVRTSISWTFAVAFRRHETEQVLAVQFVGDLRKCRTEILSGANLHIPAAGFLGDTRETGVWPVRHQRRLQTAGTEAGHLLTPATSHADPVHHHTELARAIDHFDLADELRPEPDRTAVLAIAQHQDDRASHRPPHGS